MKSIDRSGRCKCQHLLYQELFGIAWRVSGGDNVETVGTEDSSGEFGCEGERALAGGEQRVSFMFFKNIIQIYFLFDCTDLCHFGEVESCQRYNETQKILKWLW